MTAAVTRSSTSFLQTSLLSAMLGASIAFAIQDGLTVTTPMSVLAIIALVLHAVNFYHGKTIALQDVNELVRSDARPIVRGTLLFFNTVLFLTFCIMAEKIEDARYVAWGEVALRLLDFAGVASQLRYGDRSPGARSIAAPVRNQLRFWQAMNVGSALLFGGLLAALPHLDPATGYRVVIAAFAAMVALDLGVEYTAYTGNYFQQLADWGHLAERWDRLEGEYGDQYRTEILHPFVEDWIRAAKARCAVDLGSGNGCTARWVAHRAGVRVLGVEHAPAMVDLAELYEAATPRSVRYRLASIDTPAGTELAEDVRHLRGAEPDGAVAFYSLFGAQDCADLAQFFTTLSTLMNTGERALIVFETDSSFDPSAAHSMTIRTWKYSLRAGERMQIVSWLPAHTTNPTSLFATAGPDRDEVISVVTRFRTSADYTRAAGQAGFLLRSRGHVELPRRPVTPAELRYSRTPKFEFADFEYQPTPEPTLNAIPSQAPRSEAEI